jgi:CO dehydrogenase nickel-insertion accessory protein CooC1
VLLARELAARGYEVFVLDADSTNAGLHLAFGATEPPTPLIQYFGEMAFTGGAVTCPVDDPTPLPEADLSLDDLPTPYFKRVDEGICLLTGGKLGGHGPGLSCDGPIAKIARDLRINGGRSRTLTLVDLKAGIEDSARGVLPSLDWAVVVVDPTTAAVQMAATVRQMVHEIQKGTPPTTGHLDSADLAEAARKIYREARIKGVLAVLNRITDPTMEAYLADKISAEADLNPIGAPHEDLEIRDAWLHGLPVLAGQARAMVRGIVNGLEEAERNRPS